MKAFSRAPTRLGSAYVVSMCYVVLCFFFASVMSEQEAHAWLAI